MLPETHKSKPLTFKPAWLIGNATVWDPITKHRAPPWSQQRGIIVHAPNHLGDCVMALPLINQLLIHMGERLLIVTREEYKEVWSLLDNEVRTLCYAGWTSDALHQLRPSIRECGYDTALLLATGLEVAWFYLRSGIKHRLGYDYWGRGFLLSARLKSGGTPTSGFLCREHHAVNMLQLMRLTGFADDLAQSSCTTNIRLPSPGTCSKNVIGIVVGGNTQDKQFSTAFWELVIKGLQSQYPGKIFYLLGTTRHSTTGEAIMTRVSGCLNLCGETTVRQLISRLHVCDLVLSPDTGTAHLAAYLGIPTLSLFTSGSPTWTRPLGPVTDVVVSSAPCAPCFNATLCKNAHYCINQLDTEEIIRKAKALLTQHSGGHSPDSRVQIIVRDSQADIPLINIR